MRQDNEHFQPKRYRFGVGQCGKTKFPAFPAEAAPAEATLLCFELCDGTLTVRTPTEKAGMFAGLFFTSYSVAAVRAVQMISRITGSTLTPCFIASSDAEVMPLQLQML